MHGIEHDKPRMTRLRGMELWMASTKIYKDDMQRPVYGFGQTTKEALDDLKQNAREAMKDSFCWAKRGDV